MGRLQRESGDASDGLPAGDGLGADDEEDAQPCVRVVARLPSVAEIAHPALVRILHAAKSTILPHTVYVVSEAYECTLADHIEKTASPLSAQSVLSVGAQLASAIRALHSRGVRHGLLSPHAVFLLPGHHSTSSAAIRVRLALHDVSASTSNGRDLHAELGALRLRAPELIWPDAHVASVSAASDVWSLALVLLQCAVGLLLQSVWSTRQQLAVLGAALTRVRPSDGGGGGSLLGAILDALARSIRTATLPAIDDDIARVLSVCLNVSARARPSAEQLERELGTLAGWSAQAAEQSDDDQECAEPDDSWHAISNQLDYAHAFLLWRNCGATVEQLLLRANRIRTAPSINALPAVCIADPLHPHLDRAASIASEPAVTESTTTTTTTASPSSASGAVSSRPFLSNCSVFVLPMSNLQERLLAFPTERLLYSGEMDRSTMMDELSDGRGQRRHYDQHDEHDVAHQAMCLLRMERELLWAECGEESGWKSVLRAVDRGSSDGPAGPQRARVWAVLLDAVDRCSADDRLLLMHALDTVSVHVADRQLDVDLPRCHQYEQLLGCAMTRHKLRALLKSWLLRHPDLVYWQGVDSLATPFLLLNFHNPHGALLSMSAFVDRYLPNFFLKDNAPAIQELLAVFFHLLAFVDPQLYTHLATMHFWPELFAISWLLTCFAHVLPLHKLLRLWDATLLADADFPLFVGVAILRRMRARLMASSFNDAIFLFSEFPDVPMEELLRSARQMYSDVPASVSFLQNVASHRRVHKTHAPRPDRDRFAGHVLPEVHYTELKSRGACRLSELDLERLIIEQDGRTAAASRLAESDEHPAIVVLDVRTQTEWSRLHVRHSVPWPLAAGASEDYRTALAGRSARLVQVARVVCVLDRSQTSALAWKTAGRLVEQGVAGVCVLDAGWEAIRAKTTLHDSPATA